MNSRRYGKTTIVTEYLKTNPRSKIAVLTLKEKERLLKQGIKEFQIICSEENERNP